ncbi:MAG: FAD-dependent oxidoreductase [Clostridia bacterium]|nr:FAD-dependent oxidoreductase [Clostridia bacterium]
METWLEPAREIPVRNYDVVVAGGGTGGAVAAIAAARTGARTALVEAKGYVGGIAVEGGTALHSFFNLWKPFPDVPKVQLVRGIPAEIVDRLQAAGGTFGHVETTGGWDYDSVCTSIDTEIYKQVVHGMLLEAGADVLLGTMVAGAVADGPRVQGAIVESRSGRELLRAASFVDATGYGDLAAHAGARFTEPNDYPVANSMGVGGVDIDRFVGWLRSFDGVEDYAETTLPDGRPQVVRVTARVSALPAELNAELRAIGMNLVTTVMHKDHFMFIKINYKMDDSPVGRDAQAAAEFTLRDRQRQGLALLRRAVPGCENAYIARTSPSLCIRRGRCIECDYDLSNEEIVNGTHFEDDILWYGFHDFAPRIQIRNGASYGIPYRAIRAAGLDNLYAIGMMVTSGHDAHMSTRNTVSCMGQGQAAGTAAALCARNGWDARTLPVGVLRDTLRADGVWLG